MRCFWICVALLIAQTFAFGQASDRCLEEATNRQLINELERRLELDSGQESTATGNFFCDTSLYLNITLINNTGQHSPIKRVKIGHMTLCHQTLAELRKINPIVKQEIIAVCDTETWLHRYSLSPTGTVTFLERRYVGRIESCERQRKAINSRNFAK